MLICFRNFLLMRVFCNISGDDNVQLLIVTLRNVTLLSEVYGYAFGEGIKT